MNKFLEVRWFGAYCDIVSKVKDKFMLFIPALIKKESQIVLVGLF